MKKRSPPFALTTLLLIGLLPIQGGLSGTLGATEGHGPRDAAHAYGHVATGQRFHTATEPHFGTRQHPPARGGAVREAPSSPGSPETGIHAGHEEQEMPCGESGLCETGLMRCSGVSPCLTLFFSPAVPSAYDLRPVRWGLRLSLEAVPGLFDPLHPTPPPRA